MNKGVRLSTGKWLLFLNAGDTFYSSDVLENVVELELDGDLLYGGCVYDYNGQDRLRVDYPVKDLWKGVFASHQSMFFRREILGDHPFRTEYKIAADYDLMLRLYAQQITIQRLPFIVSRMDPFGLSRTSRIPSYLEAKDAALRYSSAFSVSTMTIQMFYWWKIFQELFKAPVRKVWEAMLLKSEQEKSH